MKAGPGGEKPGDVIKQEPEKDGIVPEGSTVTLFVKEVVQLPEETRVPNFDGRLFEDARQTLHDEDFKVSKKTEASDAVPAGQVIRTEPPAKTLVEPESRVTVVVSSGAAPKLM